MFWIFLFYCVLMLFFLFIFSVYVALRDYIANFALTKA